MYSPSAQLLNLMGEKKIGAAVVARTASQIVQRLAWKPKGRYAATLEALQVSCLHTRKRLYHPSQPKLYQSL
jgi:hypothetical protein